MLRIVIESRSQAPVLLPSCLPLRLSLVEPQQWLVVLEILGGPSFRQRLGNLGIYPEHWIRVLGTDERMGLRIENWLGKCAMLSLRQANRILVSPRGTTVIHQ